MNVSHMLLNQTTAKKKFLHFLKKFSKKTRKNQYFGQNMIGTLLKERKRKEKRRSQKMMVKMLMMMMKIKKKNNKMMMTMKMTKNLKQKMMMEKSKNQSLFRKDLKKVQKLIYYSKEEMKIKIYLIWNYKNITRQ